MIETPKIVGQPKPPTLRKSNAVVRNRSSRHLISLLIVAAVLLSVVLIAIAGNIEKWLWMSQTELRWHLLDSSIGSVDNVLFGFRLRLSVPVG